MASSYEGGAKSSPETEGALPKDLSGPLPGGGRPPLGGGLPTPPRGGGALLGPRPLGEVAEEAEEEEARF